MSVEQDEVRKATTGKRLCSAEQSYVQSQYGTDENLSIRIRTHEIYSETNVNFAAWVLDSIPWQGDEVVVDVGCGSGGYIEAARQRARAYFAGDLSLGMLQSLDERGVPRLNLDAQALPLREESADVILANHMLYHVPDISRALREFGRVLRPGGRLLAATNSDSNMAELAALGREAANELNVSGQLEMAPDLTFTLETGARFLQTQFTHVERRDLPGALVFPEPQPVIDYVGTLYERLERFLPDDVQWQDFAEALRAILQKKIERDGEFRVNKLAGVFVCRNT
ncbi:MAG: class I SAM-dependent methyltransferase [Chloroflexota bacterium]